MTKLQSVKYREWDEYDLSDDAALDKYALDYEAKRQSQLVQKWLELLTQAQEIAAQRKEKLAYVEAELLLKAKTGKTELGTKPTDATARAWVTTQPEYRKAQRRKRKAEEQVSYLQHARTVLEHKKNMIKIETDLWICGYFSRPNIKSSSSKKEHVDKLKQSLNKRHLRHKED
jgi:hypothetical protein